MPFGASPLADASGSLVAASPQKCEEVQSPEMRLRNFLGVKTKQPSLVAKTGLLLLLADDYFSAFISSPSICL